MHEMWKFSWIIYNSSRHFTQISLFNLLLPLVLLLLLKSKLLYCTFLSIIFFIYFITWCSHHNFIVFLFTLSMKYSATALCLILISFDFQSSLYWARMRSTHFFKRRAVSYFCQSFSPCTHRHTHTYLCPINGKMVEKKGYWGKRRWERGYLDPGARV